MPARHHTLAAQAQENLRSAQAAHRQLHLQQQLPTTSCSAAILEGLRCSEAPSTTTCTTLCHELTLRPASAASSQSSSTARLPTSSPTSANNSGQRPPQLPGIVNTGYPRRPSSGGQPSSEVPDPPLHVAAASAERTTRSAGEGAPPSSSNRPRRSGGSERSSSSHSACRAVAGSSLSHTAEIAAAAEDDDEDFADELLELEALGRSLGLHHNPEASLSEVSVDHPRPATAVSHTSCSTAVPSSYTTRGALSATSGSDSFEQHLDQDGDRLLAKESESGQETLPGALIAQQELKQCRLPHGCRIQSLPGIAAQFFFVMDVSEGPFTPATLTFWIKVFDDFPAAGNVSVRSSKKIFHPCVDPSTGRLGLLEDQLLNERGVLSLQALFQAIRQMITSPEDSPALNADAAVLLQTDQSEFRRMVRSTLNGGEYNGTAFDRVLGTTSAGSSTSGVGGTLSKKGPKSGGATSESVPESVKLGLMQIESMKDKFVQMANDWSQQNAQEIRDLS